MRAMILSKTQAMGECVETLQLVEMPIPGGADPYTVQAMGVKRMPSFISSGPVLLKPNFS